MTITEISIKRPILFIVLFLLLGILGLFTYTQLRYELLPNIATPFVTITTLYPGASPTEVETGITKPVEEAIASSDGIKRITSQSLENISMVMIEYRQGTNEDQALQEAQRKINEMLSSMPIGSKTPSLGKYSVSDLPILRISVSSNLDEAALGRILKQQIKPRIAQLSGVGKIDFVGLQENEVKIMLRPERLRALNISILQVNQALARGNLNVPSGQVRAKDADYSVRVVGKTDDLAQLGNLVVATSPAGAKVLLSELADIAESPRVLDNINRYNLKHSVGVLVSKQRQANQVEVSAKVKEILQVLEKEFVSEGVKFEIAQDGSEFTLAAAHAVNFDLGLAIALVALVMFVFLHSLRSSLIVMVAIPTSLLSTLFCMYLMGFSLNLLTLLALSLVIGILVDDSIVVLESIYHQLEKGKSKAQAALDGRNEIGFAALAITLVDVVVFVPLSIVPGLIGDLLREFSLVVVVSTLFSLLVSFTLTPMIASRFGKLETLDSYTLMGRFGLWFEGVYGSFSKTYLEILKWCLHYRKTTVSIVFGFLVSTFIVLDGGFVGGEFTPMIDKGEVSIFVQLKEGVKLSKTDSVSKMVEKRIANMPEVKKVFANVGANPDDLGIPTSNTSEISVTFKPHQERTKSLEDLTFELKQMLSTIPNIRYRVSPIGLFGGGGAAPIQLIISSDNRAEVQVYGPKIKEAVSKTPGAADLRLSGNSRKAEILVNILPDKIARYQLSTEEVGQTVRTALAGFDDIKIQRHNQTLNLSVEFGANNKNRTEQLSEIVLQNTMGQAVKLSQVAQIREVKSPAVLERKDRTPSSTLYVQPLGRAVGEIGEDIKLAIQKLNLPSSVKIVYGGDLELQDDAFGKLGLAFLAAILFMYLIMVALYNSWAYPFVVLFSIPVAIIGAVLALALTMNSLNIFSILGMIMMLGLVAKNAILLVERANENLDKGLSIKDSLLEAGETRLRPILMTTLAMVIGMLPIALATSPGAELKTGLAWALIGGLTSSMFLTLVFVPVVYFYFARAIQWIEGKRILNKTSVLITTLVLVSLMGNAQTGSEKMTIEQAVEKVKKNNNLLKISRLEELKAAQKIQEANGYKLPEVSAQVSYLRNIQVPKTFFPSFGVDPATGAFTVDNEKFTILDAGLKNNYNATVMASMPLFSQTVKNGIQTANENLKYSQIGTEVTQNQLVTEVKKAFMNVILAQEMQKIIRAGIIRAEVSLREVRQLYKVQLATDSDTLQAFVAVENQKPALSKIIQNERVAKETLKFLMGYKTDDPDFEPVYDFNAQSLLKLEGIEEKSVEYNPEIRQLQLQKSLNELLWQGEKNKLKPQLSLIGNYQIQSQANDFNFGNYQFPQVSYIGLQLNIPIYSGGRADSRIQQAKLGIQQAELQHTYTQQRLNVELQNAKAIWQDAQNRYLNQNRVIQASQRNYDLVSSKYNKGLAKRSELSEADLTLKNAQNVQLQALFDKINAEIDINKLVGK
jgi:hydrophobe/amphiphile efflux-1 (HAE1) family protein